MDNLQYTEEQIKTHQSTFITKVYAWMSIALILTGLVAYWASTTPSVIEAIFSNTLVFYGMLIGELLLVGYLVTVINKISYQTAQLVFLIYSILNGLTLSMVFLVYTSETIYSTFFVTAGTFGVMSLYGYFTKKDLTRIGNLAFMALIGIIIASIVNIFLQSPMLYWITTYVGVLIFVGLIAYDTQKLKNLSLSVDIDSEAGQKGALMGALTLYLDFINLFLLLLRVLGRRN